MPLYNKNRKLLNLCSLVVTSATTRFNAQKFYVMPIWCISTFCMDLRAISHYSISQYSIDWFVFTVKTECVYCVQTTKSLNIFHSNFIL